MSKQTRLPLDLPPRPRSSSSTRSSPIVSSISSSERLTSSPREVATTTFFDVEDSNDSPDLSDHSLDSLNTQKDTTGSSALNRIQSIARGQRSKIADMNLGQKTSAMANVARTKGAEWTRIGRDRLGKWKARNSQDQPNEAMDKIHYEPSIFGQPLEVAVERSNISSDCPVPTVVARCIEYLDCNGLTEVGLYRVPGSASAVANLKAIFDEGNDLDLMSISESPHTVATLLKMYLRELPEPIIPQDLLREFNECLPDTTEISPEQRQQQLKEAPRKMAIIATRLPNSNYFLLHWLMSHLSRLDFYNSQNKMTVSNLGLIFCPTLLISSALFTTLVVNVGTIFPLPRKTAAKMPQAPPVNPRRSSRQAILKIPAANRVPPPRPPRPPRSPPNQTKPSAKTMAPREGSSNASAPPKPAEVPVGDLIDFDSPIVDRPTESTADSQSSSSEEDIDSSSSSDEESDPEITDDDSVDDEQTAAAGNSEGEIKLDMLSLDAQLPGNHSEHQSPLTQSQQTQLMELDGVDATPNPPLQSPISPTKSEPLVDNPSPKATSPKID
ncbi:Rho GTPase activation protein [Basidiobolus meristosporus CBS 931.73]|uniref:Rho GTPase activation protein n=1 Tax=Basidiobolus meristosporus CBS 931.73 TaxID=1314790 RepID=A0A1Y1Z1B1_9FUNG|nr:Rho GTPase activation protein [Basidiobolus meristosporus CBS 931.73]|eukprot:ORY03904.1 Rho GTPase activation protein [Basidiobolus meristosporus CBS 931.73]